MALPLASQLASFGSTWSVKNTFVHCDLHTSKDVSSKWKVKTDITAARDQTALDYFKSFFYGVAVTRDLSHAFNDLDEISCETSDQHNSISTDDESDAHSNEEAMQRASFSSGAAGHFAGTCKPCAWNWKDAGCSKGAGCDFCHLCDEGAVKKRRRQKLARLRAEEKAMKRAQKEAQSFESKGDTEGL
jgi:hypothetical protein